MPEPGTVGLMLLGALTIAGMKTARGVRTGGRRWFDSALSDYTIVR